MNLVSINDKNEEIYSAMNAVTGSLSPIDSPFDGIDRVVSVHKPSPMITRSSFLSFRKPRCNGGLSVTEETEIYVVEDGKCENTVPEGFGECGNEICGFVTTEREERERGGVLHGSGSNENIDNPQGRGLRTIISNIPLGNGTKDEVGETAAAAGGLSGGVYYGNLEKGMSGNEKGLKDKDFTSAIEIFTNGRYKNDDINSESLMIDEGGNILSVVGESFELNPGINSNNIEHHLKKYETIEYKPICNGSFNINNTANIIQNKMINGITYNCQENKNLQFISQEDNNIGFSQSWFNYNQNYSPELKRDTDVIFEEKTVNEINEEFDNSDDSDQSQSPEGSISSGDSTSSSSSDSLREETTTSEEPPSEKRQNYMITLNPCKDFQEMFNDINDEEFSLNRFHQPPKAMDRNAAKRLARRLFECDGFKITDVAKHLSKRNDFSQIVGEEFANYFDFSNLRLDKALRLFLSRFTLTGETQERERIMHHFSKRYVTCNNDLYNGEDACHTLVCALIILNANTHNQNQPTMTCSDFILSLKDLNEGETFSVDNLRELFLAIEQEPIRWSMDDELVGIVNMQKHDFNDYSKQISRPPYSLELDLPRDSNCKDFMSGYVVRKWLKEPGGRKAAFGKRGWKLFYGRLRDLTLYLYKDHDKSVVQTLTNTPKRRTSFIIKKSKSLPINQIVNVEDNSKEDSLININEVESPNLQINAYKSETPSYVDSSEHVPKSNDTMPPNTSYNLVLPPADTEIHINHAYASRADDYIKKKNVFRIKTKYGSEYLFQVNTEKEMNSWIDYINYVAALLSDPEPTIGICTMEKLNARCIPLPKITTLNVRDQLESHQRCLLELEKIISSLKENSIKRLDKRTRSELDESIKFREDEFQRYKTYCQLLEFEFAKMQNFVNIRISDSDSSSFYYQPFQMMNSVPLNVSNQGIILNQQLLNNIAISSDNYRNNVILNSQQNMRFCSPVNQNFASVSANRRLRYRPFVQHLQTSPTSQETKSQTTIIANEPETPDCSGYSVPSNNTFYEIV